MKALSTDDDIIQNGNWCKPTDGRKTTIRSQQSQPQQNSGKCRKRNHKAAAAADEAEETDRRKEKNETEMDMRAVLAIKYAFVSLQHFTSTKLDERPTQKTKNKREKTHTHNKFVTIGYLPLAYALCKKRPTVRPSKKARGTQRTRNEGIENWFANFCVSANNCHNLNKLWYLFLLRTTTAASFLPYGLWPQHSKRVLELDGTTTKMPMYFLCVSLRVWWISVCVRRNVYLYFAFFFLFLFWIYFLF